MPRQKISAAQDRRRNLLAAWHLDTGKLVQLGKDLVNEEVRPIRRTNLAWVAEWSKYAFDRTIGRPAADLYLADITTGARTKLKDNINDRYVQASTGGKYLLFRQDDHYWTVNLATRAIANITKSAPVSFIDKESDQTSPEKPPFGIAGWTKDDAAVLFYDKFDLWQVAADGSKAQRLTDGTAEQVRHRLVRLDGAGGGRGGGGGDFGPAAADQGIDLSKPLYLSAYGDRTKKSGYALLKPGQPGHAPRVARQERGRARQGERCRNLRIQHAGLRRLAGHLRRRPGSEGREAGHGHQSVPEQLRLGPERTDRVQERQGTALAGRALLPGRV